MKGTLSSTLTPQEERIVETFLENGCTDKELADRFNITHETVRTHMKRIYIKMGYGSRTELAVNELHKRYARRAA